MRRWGEVSEQYDAQCSVLSGSEVLLDEAFPGKARRLTVPHLKISQDYSKENNS